MTEMIKKIDEALNLQGLQTKSGVFATEHYDTIRASLSVLKKIADGDDWFPIEDCPKIKGFGYELYDADENIEVISWFSGVEWNREGNYTKFRYVSNKKHIEMLLEREMNDE